jgi:uncharacterized glyoxalase superfamily protein PhnB
MSLMVENVETWYRQILAAGVVQKYFVELTVPEDRPWKMRDFVLIAPSGVLWRIVQNIE